MTVPLRLVRAAPLIYSCAPGLALALALVVLAAPSALALSAHNCQVIYRSLPAAAQPAQPAHQFKMMKTLLTGFYQERGSDMLIAGAENDVGARQFFSSELMAKALSIPSRSALIYSLAELEQISPSAHRGVHFIYAGSYSSHADMASHGKFAYLSQRFAQNGWTLSFLLGRSWEHQLRSAKVMLLRRIAKLTGGRGLTFFKKDVASCLVSLRPNPNFRPSLQPRTESPAPAGKDGELGERLKNALDDPDYRTL